METKLIYLLFGMGGVENNKECKRARDIQGSHLFPYFPWVLFSSKFFLGFDTVALSLLFVN